MYGYKKYLLNIQVIAESPICIQSNLEISEKNKLGRRNTPEIIIKKIII
tara:strand:+ start:140 stop:286 length:147 start_codon:yes stop_codon:yes gene_type:complete